MRGPLIMRKSFLEKHGYLDEAYVPFYQDDMDLGFRAKSLGYHVYTALFNVENKSFTVAAYSTEERKKFWIDTMKKNTDIFYKRWKPTTVKDYDWVHRQALTDSPAETAAEQAFRMGDAKTHRRKERYVRLRKLALSPAAKAKRAGYKIVRHIKQRMAK